MKISLFTLSLSALLFFGSCEDGKVEDPQPTSLVFHLKEATFNGSSIDPFPDYSLTIKFDKDGNPDGYTASGTAPFQPTLGTSGTWSIANGLVTFSSGSNSRSVTASASLTPQTTAVTLTWSLTKVDDGVSADEQGEYTYLLEVD